MSALPTEAEAARLAVGPTSIVWRRASDPRALFGAGTALLLQVSHPTVAAGVREHSDFERDPWGRLLRTLDYVHLLVYGGPTAAVRLGRQLRAAHRTIRGVAPDGTRYSALEPAAYAWVHATLAETIVAAHATFGRPLDARQRERFWAEWRGLGRILGVRERDLPVGWAGFCDYRDETIANVLGDNDVVRAVLRTLRTPEVGPPGVARPAWAALAPPTGHTLGLTAVGLLGPSARARLGLGWARSQQLEFTLLGRASRATGPLLPRRVREIGPEYLRWRARQIDQGPFARPQRTAAAA